MFKVNYRSVLPLMFLSLSLVIGGQLVFHDEAIAADAEKVFTNKDDFDAGDLENFRFDNFKDEDDGFANEAEKFNEFDDDDALRLALRLRLFGGELEEFFKDRENVDKFFDSKSSKEFLKREDLEKAFAFNKRLMDEADSRFFFADDDDFKDRRFFFDEKDDNDDEDRFFLENFKDNDDFQGFKDDDFRGFEDDDD